MKSLLNALLLTAALGVSTISQALPAQPAQKEVVTDPPTVQEAYDYAVYTLGVDPATVLYVLAQYPIVTAPQQYVHDQLLLIGFEFPPKKD